jgi:peptide chain release factor 2
MVQKNSPKGEFFCVKLIPMKELVAKITDIKDRIAQAIISLKLTELEEELDVLDEQSKKSGFWDERETAQETMQKIDSLKKVIMPWRKMETEATEMMELAASLTEGDSMIAEIEEQLAKTEIELAAHETEIYLSGKYDKLPAILSIFAGAGGVDAQDWAEMLLSMFLKYAERKDFKANVISKTDGAEAGIKNATIEISGAFAYGLLRSERGVHRLVRISPYDADKARHTSFALVEIIPEITEVDMEIPESDIRIDTYRASGHGGQGVNTTDSAVRLTHIPTGATVSVQNERSQLQNKATALKILKARVQAIKDSEREKELKIIRGDNMSAEWGSQIRSYVIHPYQMVKDHRTGQETSDTQGVLNGELDEFIEAYLKGNDKT